MTLQVPFEDFARAVQQVAAVKEAFLTSHPSGCLITAANPATSAHVVSVSDLTLDAARASLEQAGLKVFEGIWSVDGDVELEQDPLTHAFVAAVSYASSQHVPGVWVDAYQELPNHVQVLRVMYDEFRETGELPDVSFEEFVRVSNPNVVLVSATQLRGYLADKAKKADC